jgi:hypothetical protein
MGINDSVYLIKQFFDFFVAVFCVCAFVYSLVLVLRRLLHV